MALPGVSGRKQQGRFKVDPWGFGVGDTEDLGPAIVQLKKRFWQHMKEFEVLPKWLALKHSASEHHDCQSWAGCSERGSPLWFIGMVHRQRECYLSVCVYRYLSQRQEKCWWLIGRCGTWSWCRWCRIRGWAGIGLIFTSSWEGTQPGLLTWTRQTNGVFDAMSHHAWDLRGGVGGGESLLGTELGVRQWENCTVCFLLCIFFLSVLMLLLFSSSTVHLNCLCSNPRVLAFSSNSPAHPMVGEE